MKLISFILTLLLQFSFTTSTDNYGPGHFYGAWSTEFQNNGEEYSCVKIYTPTYFVYSIYTTAGHKFIAAGGGTWELSNNGITEVYEFNSKNPELVGTSVNIKTSGHDDLPLVTETTQNGKKSSLKWNKLDDGKSPLFGAWRITDRERNGQMSAMQMGPRKTMKVLSGTRFQWAAFNVETKEFLGTGGGSFETPDDEYIEHIDFFSRDDSRVGASLSFDFRREDNKWYHSGLSSKGSPIAEIWTLQDK